VFSRRIVGRRIADAENVCLLTALFDETLVKHDVPPSQLTLHADRAGKPKQPSSCSLIWA